MATSDYRVQRAALASYVARRVERLQKGLSTSSQARRELAQLRRAADTAPGSTPETWEVEFGGLPEGLAGKGAQASAGEWAAHIALTLYAIHQQSQSASMHVAGRDHGLGRAVKCLEYEERRERGVSEGERPAMPRRFSSLLAASEPDALSHHGRQVVKQLRAHGIPLDYGELGGDLFGVLSPYHRDEVRLEWCRQFVRPLPQDGDAPAPAETEDSK